MSKHYNHLSAGERAVVQIEIQDINSMRSIAKRLGRSPSTLSREVARQGSAAYSASEAGKGYRARRLRSVRRRRLAEGNELSHFVRHHLMLYRWSPQQIAAKLTHPDESSQRASYETIYPSLDAHPRGGLEKELVDTLRQNNPSRGLRRTTAAKRTWVPEQLRIVHRLEEVQQRLVAGHWQGELIKEAFNRSNERRVLLPSARWIDVQLKRRWRASVAK